MNIKKIFNKLHLFVGILITIISFTGCFIHNKVQVGLPDNRYEEMIEDISVEIFQSGKTDEYHIRHFYQLSIWHVTITNNSKNTIHINPYNISLKIATERFKPSCLPILYAKESYKGSDTNNNAEEERNINYDGYYAHDKHNFIASNNPLPEIFLLPGKAISGNIFFPQKIEQLMRNDEKSQFQVVLPAVEKRENSLIVISLAN